MILVRSGITNSSKDYGIYEKDDGSLEVWVNGKKVEIDLSDKWNSWNNIVQLDDIIKQI